MTADDRELLAKLLQDSQAGIERKTTVERFNGEVNLKDCEFIKIDKDSHLDETGTIKETIIYGVKVFICGCRAHGKNNFGGVDYKGNFTCAKHFWRCIKCRRPLSTQTIKPIDGIAYCKRCARIIKFKRFFGLKR